MTRGQVLRVATWYGKAWLDQLTPLQIVAISFVVMWLATVAMIDYPLLLDTRQLAIQSAASAKSAREHPASKTVARRYIEKDFIATLPEYETYPDTLRDVDMLADKSGVIIKRVDYQHAGLTGLPIKRVVMRMALKGSEVQFRRFLQAMLNSYPNLSIVRLAYAKAANAPDKIEQKLDVNLYYRTSTTR